MRTAAWAVVALLGMAGTVWGQAPGGLAIRDFRMGRMRITTLDRVLPVVPAKPAEPGKPAEPPPAGADKEKTEKPAPEWVVLACGEWSSGRCFRDADRRRWWLVQGPSVTEAPAQAKGWLLKTNGSDRLFFLTDQGRLYMHLP